MTDKPDMISRADATSLPPYDGDGDPAGQFDHHIFVKLSDIRALPSAQVADPAQIREAAPESEPVAWRHRFTDRGVEMWGYSTKKMFDDDLPLYPWALIHTPPANLPPVDQMTPAQIIAEAALTGVMVDDR